MPTVVTHLVIGASAYRLAAGPRSRSRLGPLVAGALSAVPDADVLWWGAVEYHEPWGHRGMTHSFFFAAVLGTAVAFLLRKKLKFPGGMWGLALLFSAVTASHGILDAMTTGGLGVAFFAPFDHGRHFLPLRPFPVSPITVNPASIRVWYVMFWEAALLYPAAVTLASIRERIPAPLKIALAVFLALSVYAWFWRLG